MQAFPVDASAIQDALESSASLNEKLANVAVDAADKSTDVTTKWTQQTLTQLAELSAKKDDPGDYAKALADFASASAELSAEIMAAYAEIAKKVQLDTVELMMAAGKDVSEDASAAVRKATGEVTAAAKKAAAGSVAMKVGKGRRPSSPPPLK